jgi:hypothetical protein
MTLALVELGKNINSAAMERSIGMIFLGIIYMTNPSRWVG